MNAHSNSNLIPGNTAKIDTKKSHVYFPNLDGLRTVAFLLVFVQHSFFEWTLNQKLNDNLHSKVIKLLFQSGGLGVSVFFVLSGFLITYLLLQEKELYGKINVGFFYIRRLLRIWPVYYLVLVYAFFIFPYLKNKFGLAYSSGNNPLYYFTFLSNFDVISNEKHLTNDPEIAVTWSVAIEEQFYLIWPLLFLIIPKKGYIWIFLVIILICQIFRLTHRNDGIVLYYHSLSVVADLALGGLCAYCVHYSKKFSSFFTNLNRAYIVVIYVLALAWVLYSGDIFYTAALDAFSRLITILFFAFIIVEQNLSKNSFFKFSNNKILSFFGKYTYGLYLYHFIVIRLVTMVLNKVFKIPVLSTFSFGLIKGSISLIVVVTISYLSYEFFEKRILKFKRGFNVKP